MIRYQVDNEGYRIEWLNEPYQQLYMFYEPMGNLFQYEGQSIRLIQYDFQQIIYNTYVLVPLVENATHGKHSWNLPVGRYRCSLYSDYNRTGKPLRYTDIFIGSQIEVFMYSEADKNGFEVLKIESHYEFPTNSIWLTFEKSLGERIFLPKMVKGGDGMYSTGCIIPPGAYNRLNVTVARDINDCISLKKMSRGMKA